MGVFVLLFNAGTDNEGIHSLKIQVGRDQGNIAQDVVLAFEEEDDATRFALLLEAQDFPEATVEKIDLEEMEAFCQEAGFVLRYISAGTLEMPPDSNLDQTDWQPDRQPTAISDLDQIRRQLENLLE